MVKYPDGLFEWFVLVIFNLPVMLILGGMPFISQLRQALKEKDPIGGTSDTTSYSRITGMVGAVAMTAFFWAIGNLLLMKAFTNISDMKLLLQGVQNFFLIGAALFLPYAFNQIKSIFSAGAVAAAVTAKAPPPLPPPPVGVAPPGLKLVIANVSKQITDADFNTAVAALQTQVARDFQPEWGLGASISGVRLDLGDSEAGIDTAAEAVIYLGDSSSDPTSGVSNAFGYHSTNHGDKPYGFVYLDVCALYQEAWSTTLSHEMLELLGDPTAVKTIAGPDPNAAAPAGSTVNYDLEVCDPTQGDTYVIGTVTVSNFITKAYFAIPGGKTQATNFLNLALDPFGVRPKGYFQYESDDGAHQIDGARVDAKQREGRARLRAWRRNERRAGRLSLRRRAATPANG
ncbi:hypothetical protein [Phenylobacterium sp.]|jgi:hypothetical protein|uniref:hypothetical protein n=1 Tax=Phenylobacterium sp. TaxID=1871053 RepID=UPI002F3FA1D4